MECEKWSRDKWSHVWEEVCNKGTSGNRNSQLTSRSVFTDDALTISTGFYTFFNAPVSRDRRGWNAGITSICLIPTASSEPLLGGTQAFDIYLSLPLVRMLIYF